MDRKKLIERIKALLSKTTANGCTEAEAMAALEMASRMMDAHNIADADITFGGEETVQEGFAYKRNNFVPKSVAYAIARYTGTKVWNATGWAGKDSEIIYFGLESDVMLANWLTSTLNDCAQRALKDYLKGLAFPTTRHKTFARNGFLMGFCSRVSDRMEALEEASRQASPVVNGRALVVVKGALVEEAFAGMNLRLKDGRRTRRRAGADAYGAGKAAGDRANFSRPVTGGAGQALIGRA